MISPYCYHCEVGGNGPKLEAKGSRRGGTAEHPIHRIAFQCPRCFCRFLAERDPESDRYWHVHHVTTSGSGICPKRRDQLNRGVLQPKQYRVETLGGLVDDAVQLRT